MPGRVSRLTRLFAALPGSEGPDRNGPGEGNRHRIVANLVIAGLIFERASECQLVLPTECGLGIPGDFGNHLLQQRERSLVNRHTLVQRFEVIDLGLGIFYGENANEGLRIDSKGDDTIILEFGTRGIQVHGRLRHEFNGQRKPLTQSDHRIAGISQDLDLVCRSR